MDAETKGDALMFFADAKGLLRALDHAWWMFEGAEVQHAAALKRWGERVCQRACDFVYDEEAELMPPSERSEDARCGNCGERIALNDTHAWRAPGDWYHAECRPGLVRNTMPNDERKGLR